MHNKLSNIIKGVVRINEISLEKEKAQGNSFNLIKLLGMASSEVFTHTPILADLLNPNGTHGQNDLFLKSFIDYFEINFDTSSSVLVEREKSEGGDQIDILISNKFQMIVIENKIYARDQKNQLYRYYKYCKNKRKNPFLIYLTMEDKKPSKYSLGKIHENEGSYLLSENNCEVEVDLLIINYHENLVGWLNNASLALDDMPNLKAGINQYINLIFQMTGQIMSNNESVMSLMLESDLNELHAINDLIRNYQEDSFRGKLLFKFFEEYQLFLEGKGYCVIDDQIYKNALYDMPGKCKGWFKNVKKEKRLGRDFIGCFFKKEMKSTLVFFVIAATEVAYYGFLFENDEDLAKMNSEEILGFNKMPNNNKLNKVWYGRKIGNIRIFNKNTFDFLVVNDNEKFNCWKQTILNDFNSVAEKII